jgi:hyperosmotically inducible protein
MRSKTAAIFLAGLLIMAVAVGCSKQSAKGPAMKDQVEQALKQNGMDKVNVDEDRDKGVITLKGEVPSDDQKMRVQQIAEKAAPGRVVANEIAIRPPGYESEAKKIESNTDDAIESNFKAAVVAHKWDNQHIRSDAKNGVLTLKGDVDTPQQRSEVEKVAAGIPGVTQVVNELDVKGKKTTSQR